MYKFIALASVAFAAPQKLGCGSTNNNSCPNGLTCNIPQGQTVGVCVSITGPSGVAMPSGIVMPSDMPMPSGMVMPSNAPASPTTGSTGPTQAPAAPAATTYAAANTTTKAAATTTAGTGNGAEKAGLALAAVAALFAL
ncbi:hypothetical protein HDV01_000839 [Terramyces sp. JEL0728]|nr:hypothetical protein HDV01_000839 [Terramyces sp. JEL0728]